MKMQSRPIYTSHAITYHGEHRGTNFSLFLDAIEFVYLCLGVRRICGHNIRNNRAKHAQGIIWE